MRRSTPAIFLLVGCLAPAASAQQASVDHLPYAGVHEWVGGITIPAVPNLPFSGKVVIESKRTLADGSTMTRRTLNLIARDSQGRTHNEGRQMQAANDSSDPKILRVIIYDPQAHTASWIYPPMHLVRVFHPRFAPGMRAADTKYPEGVTLSKTDLGTQTAEGLELHGTREIRTFPAGVFGNDHSFNVVDDFWCSPELNVNVIIRHDDPRTGVSTVALTEITRTEPDAKLFEVPADYRHQEVVGGPTALEAQGITPPKLISRTTPEYTDAARRSGVQGTVVMSVSIGEDGSVRDAKVLRSLSPDLDQSSIDAVRNWRFDPATKDGTPIPFQTTVETSFRLGRRF